VSSSVRTSLGSYLGRMLNLNYVKRLLEEYELDESVLDRVLLDVVGNNLPLLLDLYEYYQPRELLFLPVFPNYGGSDILIVSPFQELNNYVKQFLGDEGFRVSWDWLAKTYSRLVRKYGRAIPLVELFSLTPIVPLIPENRSIFLREFRRMIPSKVSQYLDNLGHVSFSLEDEFANLKRGVNALPVIYVRDLGYVPLLFNTVPIGSELPFHRFLMRVKVLREMSLDEALTLSGKDDERVLALLQELVKDVESCIDQALTLLARYVKVLRQYIDLKGTVLTTSYDEDRGLKFVLDFITNGEDSAKLSAWTGGGELQYNVKSYYVYPTLIYYPRNLGEKERNVLRLIALLYMLGLENIDLTTILREVSILPSLHVNVMISDRLIEPLVPSEREGIVIVQGEKATAGYYPSYYGRNEELVFDSILDVFNYLKHQSDKLLKLLDKYGSYLVQVDVHGNVKQVRKLS